MSTIPCADCGHTASQHAEACVQCGRPEPGKSIKQIEKDQQNAAWGILWLIHAAFVWWKMGFWWSVGSLFIGPLVWFINFDY
jgi:hypothetical protein